MNQSIHVKIPINETLSPMGVQRAGGGIAGTVRPCVGLGSNGQLPSSPIYERHLRPDERELVCQLAQNLSG